MTLTNHIITPEVTSILHYWTNRYGRRCTTYTREELLSEAYLGALETIIKYPDKSFKDLLTLISLGVKWRLCGFIRKEVKWSRVSVTSNIESIGNNDDIVGKVYVHSILEDLDYRDEIVVIKTLEGYTMPEIGKILGISKQRVFQILRRCGNRGPKAS